MNIVGIKVSKRETKTKMLERILGGNWEYRGRGGFMRSWVCDDGRVVRYTAALVDQFDNICGPCQCWIDTPNAPTEPFYWYNSK